MAGVRGVILALFVLALLPHGDAHGAPAVRGLDTRVLLDDDGETGYAPDACAPEPANVCPLASGAADLLALDLREAATATGQHLIVFRLIFQTEQALNAQELTLHFDIAGAAKTLQWQGEGDIYTSKDFMHVAGPFPVGDGHPQAIEGAVLASTLSVNVGDVLENIRATSAGSSEGDRMPGRYSLNGVAVPDVEDPVLGTYTLQGPAQLLQLDAAALEAQAVGPTVGGQFAVREAAQGLTQTVTVQSASAAVELDPASFVLESGGARTVHVRMASPESNTTVMIRLTSDLGGFVEIPWHVAAPPVNRTTTSTSSSTEKSSPALIPILAIAVAVAVQRR